MLLLCISLARGNDDGTVLSLLLTEIKRRNLTSYVKYRKKLMYTLVLAFTV